MTEKYVNFMVFLYVLKAVYFRLFLLGKKLILEPKDHYPKATPV